MQTQQLKLFRDIDSEDLKAFSNAKALKSLSLNTLKKLDLYNDDISDYKDCIIIQIKTNIFQIKESMVPDELRFFLRKIKSTVKIWRIENGAIIPDSSYNDFLRTVEIEKIIPNWANKIYTENKISLELFLDICIQNFSFSFLSELIRNDFLNQKILTDYTGKEVIFYLPHKLYPITNSLPESSYMANLENKTLKFYEKIVEAAKLKSWTLIGCFRDFTREADLINDFNKVLNKENEKDNLKTLFANDYLYLNNVEFLSEIPYTGGSWHSNIIKSPVVLKNKILPDKSALYIYTRENETAGFYRNEIFAKGLDYDLYLKLSSLCYTLHSTFVNEGLRGE